MLTPQQEAAFGIRLSMQCRRIVRDEVDDPFYARRCCNAGSAATSVSFALLRVMSSVIRARDVPSRRAEGAHHSADHDRPAGPLQAWLKELVREGATALFPNVHGGRLSADSVQSLLAKHVHVRQLAP